MRRLAFITVLALTSTTGAWARHTPILMEPAEVIDMQQTIFSSGGILELKDSYGDVEIVGWDQPQVEVTVTKTTQRRYARQDMDKVLNELDRIQVTAEEVSPDHLVIRTEFPVTGAFTPNGRKSNLNMVYRIRVPRQTRLIVNHDVGEVHVQDVAASMDVRANAGAVDVELPDGSQYDVDAQVRSGGVDDGRCRDAARLQRFTKRYSADGAYRVTVRVGVGDIIVRRARLELSTEAMHG